MKRCLVKRDHHLNLASRPTCIVCSNDVLVLILVDLVYVVLLVEDARGFRSWSTVIGQDQFRERTGRGGRVYRRCSTNHRLQHAQRLVDPALPAVHTYADPRAVRRDNVTLKIWDIAG